jgi:hypothetical protein
MVAGGEHCQLRAAIEVLVPYSYRVTEVVAARNPFLPAFVLTLTISPPSGTRV